MYRDNNDNKYNNYRARSDRRHSSKFHHNRQKNSILRILMLEAVITIIIIISSFALVSAKADNSTQHKKYYKSISIDNNETLWSIAKTYNTGNESTKEYVNNLMKINNMNSDTLYSGDNLLVYYYNDNSQQ